MAERAERERHYQRLADAAARDEAAHAARSRRYSRFRLAIVLAALGLLLAGTLGRREISGPMVAAAIAGFAMFGAAVFAHERVETERRRAVARGECAAIALARMARDWENVPEVPLDPTDTESPPLAMARAADLDLDGAASLMSLAGSLTSRAGQRMLRQWLVDPPGSVDRIRARQEAAKALARSADFREAFTADVRVYMSQRDDVRARDRFLEWTVAPASAFSATAIRWSARAWTAATVVCVAGAIATDAAWTWLWAPLALAGLVVSLAAARRIHGELDAASLGPSALSNIASLVNLAEALPAHAVVLDAIRTSLSTPVSASTAFESLDRRVGWSELRRGAPILHLPLQALSLWDFHVLFALDDWRARHGAHAAGWLDAVAELDALVALGTLAHDEPGWTFPLIDEAQVGVAASGLGHPLLPPDRRVANDVEVGPPRTVLLVTGSNMAGKSTLLRAIGTNVMLANAGAPVCARDMTLSRLTIATSLRTGDSLAHGVSGYMAGLLRLKQILDEVDAASAWRREPADAASTPPPAALYLLDEILGGTNSEERRIAVREIARHLLESHAVGALTTHDLALADEPTLQGAAVRVHFRETVEPADPAAGLPARMTFDYVLRPGLASSTNALALLRAIGLSRQS
ncbi:MAG: hypothetical protein WD690_19140 [Vicinamibacterales bacterium]